MSKIAKLANAWRLLIPHNGSMKMSRKQLIVVIFSLVALIGLASIAKANSWQKAVQLAFDPNFIEKIPKTTTITDRNGEILYYLYKDENRLMVPSQAIAETVKEAVVAAEDERFYFHQGFDTTSVLRAAVANLKEGQIVSGGSTLTMQLVKTVTGDNETSWQRKVREAYLATILENRYTKEQILTYYLNIVPLGSNIAGVETASRFYFGKGANELSLDQAATLAALISSPNYYSANHDALLKRRNYVLSRMVATGFINEEEKNKAVGTRLAMQEPVVPFKASHFVMEVVNQLKEEYGDSLYAKGLTVTTSLDIPTQMKTEQTVKNHANTLANVGAQNVGIVVADPKTGHVLAMVGSRDYFDKNNDGEVNLATAPLSYGSTLKPLIFSFLLEKEHWSPGAIMWDVKTDFPIQGERKPYTPYDYDRQFLGPMTVRQALGNSRNVTAVKALQMVGLPTTLDRLKEFGINSLGKPSDYGPSLAVGGGGIPLIQMTAAYSAFANEGRVNHAQLIVKVTNFEGKTLKENKPTNKPVIKPEVAYEIADILQDNEARKRVFGPRSLLVIDGHTVGVKTGTAEDYRSALTIGFTPDVVIGVIVANNDNSPLRMGGSGAMAAAPFFNSLMTEYLKGKPNTWIARPPTVKEVEFPTVIGKIRDLAADWQSPTDRFNRRIAEIDDPLWNRAVGASRTRSATTTTQQSPTAETAIGGAEPANAEEKNDNANRSNRGRGRDRDNN